VELDSEPLVSTHTFCRDPDRYFGVDLKHTMRVDGLGVQIPHIGGTARNGNDVHGAFDALFFFAVAPAWLTNGLYYVFALVIVLMLVLVPPRFRRQTRSKFQPGS